MYAENGESFDITEYADLYTFDVLLRCIYSYDSNCVEKKRSVFIIVPVIVCTNIIKLMILMYLSAPAEIRTRV